MLLWVKSFFLGHHERWDFDHFKVANAGIFETVWIQSSAHRKYFFPPKGHLFLSAKTMIGSL